MNFSIKPEDNISCKNITNCKGGSILIALIVATIMTSISISISGIVTKELILSSFGTHSNQAFYVADMGAECALFWDLQLRQKGYVPEPAVVFATSTSSTITSKNIRCLDTDIISDPVSKWPLPGTPWPASSNASAATTTFRVYSNVLDTKKPCANISVAKNVSTLSQVQNSTLASGLSGSPGNNFDYTLPVPSGATNLSFTMSGGTGDADLYVRFGSPPTLADYDCRPYLNGNNEMCGVYATPQSGIWHARVRGYNGEDGPPTPGFTGVSLVASYTANNNILTTKVESRGLSSCDLTNPRIVERAVRIVY